MLAFEIWSMHPRVLVVGCVLGLRSLPFAGSVSSGHFEVLEAVCSSLTLEPLQSETESVH